MEERGTGGAAAGATEPPGGALSLLGNIFIFLFGDSK